MNLPRELTMIEEDLTGEYESNTDCPLARALKRAGVLMARRENGYAVSSGGSISRWRGDEYEPTGYRYVWDNGEEFNWGTLEEGRLVLYADPN